MSKTHKLFLVLITLVLALSIFLLKTIFPNLGTTAKSFLPTPTPPITVLTPAQQNNGLARTVKPAEAYTIIMIGDSMTQLLGQNNDYLRKFLKNHYPNKTFGIFNYGLGSSNILSVDERLNKETYLYSQNYPPILKREFDLILIESFGNNPLSEFKLEEGLKKQTEALDSIVKQIKDTHPNSVIVFVATIAPNRNRYGEGAVVLSPEKRHEWADERIAYFKNHIKYAQDHGIYLINIYDKSLKDGDGNIDYLNSTDFIHPSPTGIEFISRNIAQFIYDNKILPP